MAAVVSLKELLSAEGRRDPYPFYAGLHAAGEAAPLSAADKHAVAVYGYEAVGRVLRDPTFRVLDVRYMDGAGFKRWRDHAALRVLHASIFNASGERHAQVRRLFGQAVSPRRIGELEPLIVRFIDRLLDQVAMSGADGRPVDLAAEFAVPLPLYVISELVGVPTGDLPFFPSRVRDFDTIIELGIDNLSFRQIRAADVAAAELAGYFADLLAQRRKQPRADLVSALAQVRADDPDWLSEDELVANLVIFFNAAFRSTSYMIANAVSLLADHPDANLAVRARPSDALPFLEEVLRYRPPVHFSVRYAAEDTDIDGVPVEKGQSVVVLTAAANRDPKRFRDPDRFDAARPDNHHFAFNVGPHFCLGAALARLEGHLAAARVASRFPALARAGDPVEQKLFMLRGYDQLPMRVVSGEQ